MILLVDSKLMAYNVSYNADRPMTDMLCELKYITQELEAYHNSKVSKVIMGFDFGKSGYRLGLYPLYKAGRKYHLMPEDFQRNYRENLPELVSMLGIGVMATEGVECDDLIGILLENYKGTEEIVLVTGDRDWLQLTINRPNVHMYDPRQRKKIITDCKSIPQFLVEKTLKGDNSDNIYGVFNCGPKAHPSFINKVFSHKHSYTGTEESQIQFLKDMFIRYCNSNPKFGIHPKYQELGIASFEELFEFNMALGGIFKDTSLMTPVQTELFTIYRNELAINKSRSIDEIQDLAQRMAGDRTTMFGDEMTMPEDTIKFFQGMWND